MDALLTIAATALTWLVVIVMLVIWISTARNPRGVHRVDSTARTALRHLLWALFATPVVLGCIMLTTSTLEQVGR